MFVEPEREKVQLSSQISAPSSTIVVASTAAAPASLFVASQAAVATDSTFATASSSDDDAASKKAIHLRLGPMTKTWKNKKSWRSEKVLIFSMIIKLNFLFYNFVQISVGE